MGLNICLPSEKEREGINDSDPRAKRDTQPSHGRIGHQKGHDFVTRNLTGNKMKVNITKKYRSICIRTKF